MYHSFQTPPESINYLFALARTSSQSEFFSDFGKVTKISIQTSKNHKCNFFLFFCFFGVYTGWGVYARSMRNCPEGKIILVDMSDTLSNRLFAFDTLFINGSSHLCLFGHHSGILCFFGFSRFSDFLFHFYKTISILAVR